MADVDHVVACLVGIVQMTGVHPKWLVSFLTLADQVYVRFYSFCLPCGHTTTHEPGLLTSNIILAAVEDTRRYPLDEPNGAGVSTHDISSNTRRGSPRYCSSPAARPNPR